MAGPTVAAALLATVVPARPPHRHARRDLFPTEELVATRSIPGKRARKKRVNHRTARDIPVAATSAAWDGGVPDAATAVIKRIEGFFATPYDDNGGQPGGTWTIGYGTIVDRDGHPVTPKTPPVTEADAVLLLCRDMAGAARDVRLRVKVPLAMCEAAALISWTYNLGAGSLAKSTMLTRINANRKGRRPCGNAEVDQPGRQAPRRPPAATLGRGGDLYRHRAGERVRACVARDR
jgi:GH24 family phage-related lysozyme (muramidase)